ncbi:MAG: uncharacterized protein KVP18_004929 [Porospora cf. gigantea A]|uniref:uncharacterized protein n=2 Tax=Porospora cf. gigantea A TaxID=2853593 RepID=UPI003559A52C|nr:MAG: hypothetical protein KVP18_004929 [Porospora cf. gigantea A]
MTTSPVYVVAPRSSTSDYVIALGIIIPVLAVFLLLCIYCLVMGILSDSPAETPHKTHKTHHSHHSKRQDTILVIDSEGEDSKQVQLELQEEKEKAQRLLERIETLERTQNSA